MTTWTVDSTTLNMYLPLVQSGDQVLLAPGVYSGLSFKGLSFDGGVTIASADPQHQAVLTDFTILNSAGLTFSNIEMATKPTTGFAYSVRNSTDIHFDHVSVHGSLDGDASNDGNGITINGSSNISITNSEFQQLGRAVATGSSSNVQLIGNTVHDMRTDGFDFAQVDHLLVSGNSLSNFHPVSGDHPDAIQFWDTGTTAPSHDITITGNVIERGDGVAAQGVFMRETSGLLYDHVTISNNFINGTGFSAIRIIGGTNLTISGNELISNPGKTNVTNILIQNADHVTSLNNDAIMISFDHVTNLVESGDTLNTAVTDLGVAAMQTFGALHPESMALLATYLPEMAFLPGGASAPPPFSLMLMPQQMTMMGQPDFLL